MAFFTRQKIIKQNNKFKNCFLMDLHDKIDIHDDPVFDLSTFSLLISLRCQIHTELAKCEEDQEQIQVAMEHLVKVSGTLTSVKVGGSCYSNVLLLFYFLASEFSLYRTCMKITFFV